MTELIQWIDKLCGDEEIGLVTAKRGNEHDCLSMSLKFDRHKGEVEVNMTRHVNKMAEDCPIQIGKRANSPANDNLFSTPKSGLLNKQRAEQFRMFAKLCVWLKEQDRTHH